MNKNEKVALVPRLRFPEFRNAPNWQEKQLGEIGVFYKGKGISKADIDKDGITKCIRYGELYTTYGEVINEVYSKTNISRSSLFLSRKNDVILPSSGETKIDIATASCVRLDDIALGGDLNVIRSQIDGMFLSYYLNGAKRYEIASIAQGDTVVHLYANKLMLINILIPESLEQQKIADFLSSLDDLIAAEGKKLEAFKAHKKGLMQKLFPAEGKTLPEWRFPEFRDSEEWEEKPLAKVGEIITGNTPSTADVDNYGGNRMFVSPADMSELKYVVETKTKLTEKGFSATRKIPSNSVMFVCIGSTIGKVAQNKSECATNQQINSVVPFEDHISDFIYYVLDFSSSKISKLAGKQAVPIVNKSLFSSVVVSVPEYNEQQKIADCLSSIDDLIAGQAKKMDALKLHKKGLMQGLFPSIEEVSE